MTRLDTSAWNPAKLTTKPPRDGLAPDVLKYSYDHWNPGHRPLAASDYTPNDPLHLERLATDKGIISRTGGGAGTTPWGCYEKARYEGPREGQTVEVRRPHGSDRLDREQLLQLATYPSELFYWNGSWICPLDRLPGSAQEVMEAVRALPERQPIPAELGIQWLKYCADREGSYQIRGDGIGATYQWGDLLALLEPRYDRDSGKVAPPLVTLLREGEFVVATQEGIVGPGNGGAPRNAAEPRHPVEQEIKALRWPHAEATVTFEDGTTAQVGRTDLQRMATLVPYDIALVGAEWVLTRPDQQLLTEDSLDARLMQIPDGPIHDWQLILDCAKIHEPKWLFTFHSTAPQPSVEKHTRRGVPFVVFVEQHHRYGYR